LPDGPARLGSFGRSPASKPFLETVRMALNEQLPSQEELLLDYAERLANHRQGRMAVHVHLSRLLPEFRQEHHLRIAAETFDHLIKRHAGQIFRLSNGDQIIVVKDAKISEIDEVVLKLRFFFRTDPLMALDVLDGERDPFATWYNLEADYTTFLAEVYEHVECWRTIASNPLLALPDDEEPEPEPQLPAITPVQLARIEATLNSMDVAPFIQRHLACTMDDGMPPRPVFCDHVISFDAIGKVLTPKQDLRAEPWLFQRMQEIINPRILTEIADVTKGGHLPVGIKLPVSSVLSPQFLKFDHDIRPKIARRILIEFDVVDVFVNTASFTFARDFLRGKDYRVSIGGLSPQTFALVDREAMDVDFEKVLWSPSMTPFLLGQGAEYFREAVERVGINRVVLANCDTRRALESGLDCGVRIFQGRYITQALNNSRGQSEAASA
jgi:hypothetical protein